MTLRNSLSFIVCATPCWGFLLSFRVGVTGRSFCSSLWSYFLIPLPFIGLWCELPTRTVLDREAPYCFSSAAEVLFRQNKTRARRRAWRQAEGQGTEAWSWLGSEEDEAQEAQEGKYCYGSHLPLCPLAGGQEWNSCIWCTCPTQKPVTQTPSILSEEQMMVKV